MKLILNNENNKIIKVDHIAKDYNFDSDNLNLDFVLDCTLDSLEFKNTLNYLENFFYEPITSYKVINELDDTEEEQIAINAELKNYSENFSDGYFFARFTIFVYKNQEEQD